MCSRTLGLRSILVLIAASWPAVRPVSADDSAFRITIEAGHPWRAPFGLDRVGANPTARIESAAQRPLLSEYRLTVLSQGKEVDRRAVSIPMTPPFIASVPVSEYGDEVVLSAVERASGERTELARRPLRLPSIEFDATAKPDAAVNPVDLGAILVPHDWLLLGPGQGGTIEAAMVRRDRDETGVRVRAFFESAPGHEVSAPSTLPKGAKQRLTIKIPRPPESRDRDALQVLLQSATGQELARKSIPVMLVQNPPAWPRFGAAYTKLRYDAPISVRDPKTGAFSSLKYEEGWDPSLQDVVVCLPNGARFVFWRGSSYIPFWAGEHNTGACYEWAEMISRVPGAVDCVEPLMDKELRYGRVEIVESTPARVHVRWRYQSTDLHYQTWGDEAVEDYYFHPDGFGTRVLNLKADPSHDYELSEFIILTPQSAYPFDVLPENLVDAIGLDGRKHGLRFPSPEGALDAMRKAMKPPIVYRLHLNKRESMSAVYFNPLDSAFPELIFGAFSDQGRIVTPCYWGSHWPLARGNATGSRIDDRIALTPCHNSVMSWARAKPGTTQAGEHAGLDARGRSKLMSFRQWVWLIGMSDASDQELMRWAQSFADPPTVEIQGGRLDFNAYASARRAIRLGVRDRKVTIKLSPRTVCVNPVFELDAAPGGPLTVTRDGIKMSPDRFAWDGRTLWLDAMMEKPTEIGLEFQSARRLDTPPGRP